MAKAKHTIRIISGTHRSRRVPILNFDGLRPTGDRVRETLFNWLQMEIAGQCILDLCAGAGSLGFEAASRSAKQVVMVENQKAVANQLQYIQKEFKFDQVKIYCKSAEDFLVTCKQKFDVVFLDPPFAKNLLQELSETVLNFVNVEGYLYREAALNQELINLPLNWQLVRQKVLGQVRIELWKKISDTYQLKEETIYV